MIFWIVPFLCHLNNLKNENMLDLEYTENENVQ